MRRLPANVPVQFPPQSSALCPSAYCCVSFPAEDVISIWLKLLRERSNDEEWHVYRAAEKGELPTVDADYHGVIIPGSR